MAAQGRGAGPGQRSFVGSPRTDTPSPTEGPDITGRFASTKQLPNPHNPGSVSENVPGQAVPGLQAPPMQPVGTENPIHVV